ncbi:MAG: acetate kinase [Planctomycetes bacterium]|nr:acetate kinase [Planctomycetota bacterium]
MDILTLNCGSSSVKYMLYRWDTREIVAEGVVQRVGIPGTFIEHYAAGKDEFKITQDCPVHTDAIQLIIDTLLDSEKGVIADLTSIKGVGHRMVHGGEVFAKSAIIDDKFIETFKKLSSLAPLHNPPNIMGVEAAKKLLPNVPHCAIMDTAWHQTMPEHVYMYALPYEWYEKYGARRYGFHGSSLLYCSKRASVLLGKNPFETNVVILHIGNGASANAVKNGVSYDTSMGLTPLEGLVMGTRAGDHDAGIDFFMMRNENLNVDAIDKALNKKSGLLGLTKKYSDRRDIEIAAEDGDERCKLAIELEAYRLRKYVGAYTAALGRVDAIVFTAGVGEKSPLIRQKTLEGLENLGIVIDSDKNKLSKTRNAESDITGAGSKVKIFVIPTDEEIVFVEDTIALIEGRYDVHTNFEYSFQDKKYRNPARDEALIEELKRKPYLADIIAKPENN